MNYEFSVLLFNCHIQINETVAKSLSAINYLFKIGLHNKTTLINVINGPPYVCITYITTILAWIRKQGIKFVKFLKSRFILLLEKLCKLPRIECNFQNSKAIKYELWDKSSLKTDNKLSIAPLTFGSIRCTVIFITYECCSRDFTTVSNIITYDKFQRFHFGQ